VVVVVNVAVAVAVADILDTPAAEFHLAAVN
jgi:hypothetical protein